MVKNDLSSRAGNPFQLVNDEQVIDRQVSTSHGIDTKPLSTGNDTQATVVLSKIDDDDEDRNGDGDENAGVRRKMIHIQSPREGEKEGSRENNIISIHSVSEDVKRKRACFDDERKGLQDNLNEKMRNDYSTKLKLTGLEMSDILNSTREICLRSQTKPAKITSPSAACTDAIEEFYEEQSDLSKNEKNSGPSEPSVRASKHRTAFRETFPMNEQKVKSLLLRKEPLREFVAKKREMLILEVCLKTKKDEIRNLHALCEQRRLHLERLESKIEEDALKFDRFLKENDRATQEAVRKSEKETKQKQRKQFEIKQLKEAIYSVEAESGGLREQRDACVLYKTFLAQLQEIKSGKARSGAQAENMSSEMNLSKTASTLGIEEMQDDVSNLSFIMPEDLLNVFAEIEENTLFLLKNSQETGKLHESLVKKHLQAKGHYGKKISKLEKQTSKLRQAINQVAQSLVSSSYGSVSQGCDSMEAGKEMKGKPFKVKRKLLNIVKALRMIEEKVVAVASLLGIIQTGGPTQAEQRKETDSELTGLQRQDSEQSTISLSSSGSGSNTRGDTTTGMHFHLLTELESCLEGCIKQLQMYDREMVASEEKKRERERREKIRKLKAKQQEELMEQKLQGRRNRGATQEGTGDMDRVPSNSNLQVVKKKQKPLMFRSYLNNQPSGHKRSADQAGNMTVEHGDSDSEFFR